MTAMTSELAQSALSYAELGWKVFPCSPNGKTPACKHGHQAATTDPAAITAWWTENPNYNIGISCGTSSLLVIDLDEKPDSTGRKRQGKQQWQHLKELLAIPDTPTVAADTPSGGQHLYYHVPQGTYIRSTVGTLDIDIDTRGEGGYVLAPPSVINGKPYVWRSDSENVIDIPPQLVRAIGSPRKSISAGTLSTSANPITPQALDKSLLSIIETNYQPLTRKGSLDEWCGPCPWCGGHDRFVVGWEGEGRDGGQRYFCRQCNKKGDSIQWLQDWGGLSEETAFETRGVKIEEWTRFKPFLDADHATRTVSEAILAPITSENPLESHRHDINTIANAIIPRQEWLVDGFLEKGCLYAVYGGPGSLKSFLIADLSVCIANGTPWLPQDSGDTMTVAQQNVVWIDMDMGKKRSYHRFNALARGSNRHQGGSLNVYIMPPLKLSSPKSVQDLVQVIKLHGAGLLVIDTFVDAAGLDNENDNTEIQIPLQALRTIAESTGCTIIVIHHPRKGAAGGDDMRGGSAFKGKVDASFRIVRPDLRSTKVIIEPNKERGDTVEPFGAELIVNRNFNGDMDTAHFSGTGHAMASDTVSAKAREDALRLRVQHALESPTAKENNGLNTNQIRAITGGRKEAIINTLTLMELEGAATQHKAGRSVLWSLSF